MEVIFFLIVICTAIVGFFSQEFLRTFQRIFSIPGGLLFIPLVIASFIIESNLVWGWSVLMTIRSALFRLETYLAESLPQHIFTAFFIRAFLLTIISVLPMLMVKFIFRKKQASDAMFFTYRFSVVIWVIAIILLVSVVE